MNLPNMLTVFRVFMIPFFVAAFLMDGVSHWITLSIFVLAAITDALDGFIARKKHLVTDFGRLMDPLADKLMVMAAFVCLTYEEVLHPAITIIVLAREFLVTGVRMIATSKGKVIPADILGKAKTVCQDITIMCILVKLASGVSDTSAPGTFVYFIIWIMVILTLVSAIHYCIKNKEIFKAK